MIKYLQKINIIYFVTFSRKIFENSSINLILASNQISEDYFNRIRKKYFPKIKVPKYIR
jgi:hypothetical protein